MSATYDHQHLMLQLQLVLQHAPDSGEEVSGSEPQIIYLFLSICTSIRVLMVTHDGIVFKLLVLQLFISAVVTNGWSSMVTSH